MGNDKAWEPLRISCSLSGAVSYRFNRDIRTLWRAGKRAITDARHALGIAASIFSIFFCRAEICDLRLNHPLVLAFTYPTTSEMSIPNTIRHRSRKRRQRRGTAAIEFAFIVPVLIVLTLGTIDLCSMMFLKESVTLAACEGARRGIGRDRTDADVVARVTEFLDERNINYDSGSVVNISSPGFTGAATLENVTITVQVPCGGNLLIPSNWFDDMTLSASVTMRKEYQNLN